MATEPTADQVAAYLGLPPDTEGLDQALAVALLEQAKRCTWEDGGYDDSLAYAATRRAARVYAARAHVLGTVDAGEYGSFRLARWDAEIDAAEAHALRGGFA